jgi:hypothetical protein
MNTRLHANLKRFSGNLALVDGDNFALSERLPGFV